MFTHAIVRPPSKNFADGLTHGKLGKPDVSLAIEQHARYCEALERCGLALTRMAADDEHPDSTFVEDTAVLTAHAAILTHPGAASRKGEVASIAAVLPQFFSRIEHIVAPGTLDGGDICQCDNHFFIGISERTNAEGARQLATLLAANDYTSTIVDIRAIREDAGILHLKSGISYLGDNRLVLIDALADHAAFRDYEIVRISARESYAANFLQINGTVIVSAGQPDFAATLSELGYPLIALQMSEFQKMDGSLTCLSLRF
jgi:dimethylargininase